MKNILLIALLFAPQINAEVAPGALGQPAVFTSGLTSANPVTCNSSQSICEGTYTPTYSSLVNITGSPSTTWAWHFVKIYNEIHVFGSSDINLTVGAGTLTSMSVTLPIARGSNFTVDGKCSGTGKEDDGGNSTWSIRSLLASSTNIRFQTLAQNTGIKNQIFHFSYRLN